VEHVKKIMGNLWGIHWEHIKNVVGTPNIEKKNQNQNSTPIFWSSFLLSPFWLHVQYLFPPILFTFMAI
jgi:hypothetical protein